MEQVSFGQRIAIGRGEASRLELPLRRVYSLVAVIALLVLLQYPSRICFADSEVAKPTLRDAKERFTAGNRLYRLREFDKAIVEYKAGALIEDVPVFHYNLGQCYRQLGRYEDAIWHYERFIDRGSPPDHIRAAVEDFIRQMKSELERKAMTQTPTDAVEEGPSAAGRTGSRGTEVRAAAAQDQPRTAVPPSTFTTKRKVALALGGSSIALLGVATAFAVHGSDLREDADGLCPSTTCDRAAEANALITRSDRNIRNAQITAAVGIGAAAVAALLWFTGKPEKRSPDSITASPYAGPGSAGIDILVRF